MNKPKTPKKFVPLGKDDPKRTNYYGEAIRTLCDKYKFKQLSISEQAKFGSHGHLGNIIHGRQQQVYMGDREKIAACFPQGDRSFLEKHYVLDQISQLTAPDLFEYVKAWEGAGVQAKKPAWASVFISPASVEDLTVVADRMQHDHRVVEIIRNLASLFRSES